jgi:hypothetical protein
MGVAQVVEADPGYVGALHDAVEQLAERFRVEEPTPAVEEHPVIGTLL